MAKKSSTAKAVKMESPKEEVKDYRADLRKLLSIMQDSIDAMEQAEAAFNEKRIEVEARDREVAERSAKLAKKANELKDKEVAVEKRIKEVSEQVKRIDTVAEAKEKIARAEVKMSEARELVKNGNDALAEAKAREKQIYDRELALQKEKGEYKAKIRQEIVNNFLKK